MTRNTGWFVGAILLAAASYYLSGSLNVPRGNRSGAAATNPPRLVIDPPALDLGRFDPLQETDKKGQFRVANHGAAPLSILGLNTSCGCTVADLLPQTIPPGAVVTAQVRISPRRETGFHQSTITILTNDPRNRSAGLNIRWTEQEPISVMPKTVDFGRIAPGNKGEAVVRVEVSDAIEPKKLSLSGVSPCLTSAWNEVAGTLADRERDHPRNAIDLRLTLDPGKELGPQSLELLIKSVDERFSKKLAVRWELAPRVELSPSAIFKTGVKKKSRVDNMISIRSAAGDIVDIAAVRLDGEPLPFATRLVAEQGRSHRIVSFTIEAGESSGVERHLISIEPRGLDIAPLTLIAVLLVD